MADLATLIRKQQAHAKKAEALQKAIREAQELEKRADSIKRLIKDAGLLDFDDEQLAAGFKKLATELAANAPVRN